MMSVQIAKVIEVLLAKDAKRSRLKIGLLCHDDRAVAERIAPLGRPTLVIGDRFTPLFRLQRKFRHKNSNIKEQPLLIEAQFEALPLSARSLDVLIVSNKLPTISSRKDTLIALRELLKQGGRLIWPHPVSDGGIGTLSRAAPLQRPRKREELTLSLMEAGYRNIRQTEVGKKLIPWVITTGRVGTRPWQKFQVEEHS